MRVSRAVMLSAALLLAACAQGDDPSGLLNGGPGGIDPAAGAGGAGASLASLANPNGYPVNSQQFFSQVIGDRVFFEVDQSVLTSAAAATLDLQAQWLQANPGAIVIEGHADEQGTREYNIALSARRASAVRNYLVAKGIPDSRLSTVPFGKERPVEVCSSERCWSQNRRAVTVVRGGAGA